VFHCKDQVEGVFLKCFSAQQETRSKSHVISKGEASEKEDEIVCSQKKKNECRAFTISLKCRSKGSVIKNWSAHWLISADIAGFSAIIHYDGATKRPVWWDFGSPPWTTLSKG